jgi:hypothetical protein
MDGEDPPGPVLAQARTPFVRPLITWLFVILVGPFWALLALALLAWTLTVTVGLFDLIMYGDTRPRLPEQVFIWIAMIYALLWCAELIWRALLASSRNIRHS